MAEKKTSPNLTGAFELFGKSAELVQRNFNNFLILFALPLILAFVGSVRNAGGSNSWTASSTGFSGLPVYVVGGLLGTTIIVTILIAIVGLFIQAMSYGLELKASEGKTPSLSHLFELAKKYWLRLFGLSIVVGVMTFVGLILLIVPGLIVIRRYFLAPYLLIDKDLSIGEAMKQSADMSKPYSGWVWSVIGVMVLLGLPSVIPLIGRIISLILVMFYSVAPALRYQELKKLTKS